MVYIWGRRVYSNFLFLNNITAWCLTDVHISIVIKASPQARFVFIVYAIAYCYRTVRVAYSYLFGPFFLVPITLQINVAAFPTSDRPGSRINVRPLLASCDLTAESKSSGVGIGTRSLALSSTCFVRCAYEMMRLRVYCVVYIFNSIVFYISRYCLLIGYRPYVARAPYYL